MTDPIVNAVISDAEKAGSVAVSSAETAAKAQVVKQEGWVKANLKPVLIGLAIGVVLGWIAHGIL